jgi:hypothetical protein
VSHPDVLRASIGLSEATSDQPASVSSDRSAQATIRLPPNPHIGARESGRSRLLHEGGCDGMGAGRSSSVPRPAGWVHRRGGVVLDCEAVARIPGGQDRVQRRQADVRGRRAAGPVVGARARHDHAGPPPARRSTRPGLPFPNRLPRVRWPFDQGSPELLTIAVPSALQRDETSWRTTGLASRSSPPRRPRVQQTRRRWSDREFGGKKTQLVSRRVSDLRQF